MTEEVASTSVAAASAAASRPANSWYVSGGGEGLLVVALMSSSSCCCSCRCCTRSPSSTLSILAFRCGLVPRHPGKGRLQLPSWPHPSLRPLARSRCMTEACRNRCCCCAFCWVAERGGALSVGEEALWLGKAFGRPSWSGRPSSAPCSSSPRRGPAAGWW